VDEGLPSALQLNPVKTEIVFNARLHVHVSNIATSNSNCTRPLQIGNTAVLPAAIATVCDLEVSLCNSLLRIHNV